MEALSVLEQPGAAPCASCCSMRVSTPLEDVVGLWRGLCKDFASTSGSQIALSSTLHSAASLLAHRPSRLQAGQLLLISSWKTIHSNFAASQSLQPSSQCWRRVFLQQFEGENPPPQNLRVLPKNYPIAHQGTTESLGTPRHTLLCCTLWCTPCPLTAVWTALMPHPSWNTIQASCCILNILGFRRGTIIIIIIIITITIIIISVDCWSVKMSTACVLGLLRAVSLPQLAHTSPPPETCSRIMSSHYHLQQQGHAGRAWFNSSLCCILMPSTHTYVFAKQKPHLLYLSCKIRLFCALHLSMLQMITRCWERF